MHELLAASALALSDDERAMLRGRRADGVGASSSEERPGAAAVAVAMRILARAGAIDGADALLPITQVMSHHVMLHHVMSRGADALPPRDSESDWESTSSAPRHTRERRGAAHRAVWSCGACRDGVARQARVAPPFARHRAEASVAGRGWEESLVSEMAKRRPCVRLFRTALTATAAAAAAAARFPPPSPPSSRRRQAHIDGCTYIGPGGLRFAQTLAEVRRLLKYKPQQT